MSILDYFRKRRVVKKRQQTQQRSYSSAKYDNLFSGWNGTNLSADEELINSLQTMRNRVRQVCNDNTYARKFLEMVKANVTGPTGIIMQSKARRDDGTFDQQDIDKIERAWLKWGRDRKNCSADKRMDWVSIQRLVVGTLARDGEVFIRYARDAGNPFNFSVYVMEGDHFALHRNQLLDGDKRIVMSVEQNSYGQPLAYYQTTYGGAVLNGRAGKAERVPADEILHLYLIDRPGQSRGIPWMNTALRGLEMLEQYQESELVASRIGSSAMGFFKSPSSEGYTGTDTDAQGNLITEFAPGTFQQLPEGVDFEPFTPAHPTNVFPVFVKSCLRGIASGLGVSYNGLSSDLESVNYSSIRAGVQEERAFWESLQRFVISNFCQPVFEQWLRMAITSGQLNLPMAKIEKFEEVKWIPRGWSYVDPLKEINAHRIAVEMGVESLTEIAASRGKDLADVFDSLEREKNMAEAKDLILPVIMGEQPVQTVQTITEDE